MKALALVMACCLSFSARAIETEITVLGLTLPGADSAKALAYMLSLLQHWPSSDTGTSIGLVNAGVPIPFASTTSGTPFNPIEAAKLLVGGVRDQYGADVILFFSPRSDNENGFAICGWVTQ